MLAVLSVIIARAQRVDARLRAGFSRVPDDDNCLLSIDYARKSSSDLIRHTIHAFPACNVAHYTFDGYSLFSAVLEKSFDGATSPAVQ